MFNEGCLKLDRCRLLLSKNESQKAERFVYRADYERYVYFHGALRYILSAYTNIPAHLISFKENAYGKPYVDTQGGHSPIKFNMSHSKNICVVAITRGREIGIDVEAIRNISDAREIVKKYFSSDEQKLLLAAPEKSFFKLFFVCWTQKEAFAKAIGNGLSYQFDQFSTPIYLNKNGSSVFKEGVDGKIEEWKFESFNIHPGYIGSFVTKPYSEMPTFLHFPD